MPVNRKNFWFFAGSFIVLVYCLIEAIGWGDLYIYLCAAGDLSKGEDIYVKEYVNEDYNYFYSVFFALLLQPFYQFPFYPVKFVWLLINCAMFFHLLWMLYNSAPVKSLRPGRRQMMLFLTFLFSLRFFHDNIHTSQITILILWCTIFGLVLIFSGRIITGSLLLALAINIKLLPVVFVPYLIYRAEWKALFWVCFSLLLLYLLPSVFIGHEYNMHLLQSWLRLINPLQQRHVLDVDERSFHGLSTLLATLLVKDVPDYYALPLKRNIADLSLPALNLVLNTVRVFLVLSTLFFLSLRPFRQANNNWQRMLEISYMLLLVPLIFPHQQHYAFLFAAPAFCLVLFYLVQTYGSGDKKGTIILLVMIYLSANLKMLLGAFNHYYEHYKILTYGALLLIPLLMQLRWITRGSDPLTKLRN